jgi:hypothetical protein
VTYTTICYYFCMLLFLVYRVKTKLLHLTGSTVHPNISCSANICDNSEVQATRAAQPSSRIDTDKMVMGRSRTVIDRQQHHQHSSTKHQLFEVAERLKSSFFRPVPSQLSLPDLSTTLFFRCSVVGRRVGAQTAFI